MSRTSARSMAADELKRIRIDMGYDKASMAALLGWCYRTYQDREYGKRGIGPDEADQVRNAQSRDRELMAGIRQRVNARLDKEYPNGIPSAPLDFSRG